MRISANLGFLWTELPLIEQVQRAAAAGFDAVECHYPYATDPVELRSVLTDCALPLLSLNTGLGAGGADDFGVAALPGREPEARALIDQAIDYAAAVGCQKVSVIAGKSGRADGSEAVFRDNLIHACERAADAGCIVLLEPISQLAVPNYHLSTVDDALDTLAAVGADNLQLMIDCFHCHHTHTDIKAQLQRSLAVLGHVQIAALPDRGEPDHAATGDKAILPLLQWLQSVGWQGDIGAEYVPAGESVEAGLAWLPAFRSALQR